MGSAVSKSNSILEHLSLHPRLQVVLLGLDNAGKSTSLYRLKLDQYITFIPTIGFNCEKIKGTTGKSKGVNFMIWDVGGTDKIRPLWRYYTKGTDGIVFIVDSANKKRMEEAKLELLHIVRIPDVAGVPILVLANKQDLIEAIEPKEVEKLLGLDELDPSILWDVKPTCAITGEGLEEALDALYGMIQKHKKLVKASKKKILF